MWARAFNAAISFFLDDNYNDAKGRRTRSATSRLLSELNFCLVGKPEKSEYRRGFGDHLEYHG
jgi:hypothetical protein